MTAYTVICLLLSFWCPSLDAQIPVQWSKPYGTSALEFARHGIQTRDEGFIAVGNHWSPTGNFIDYMVVKTDKDGQLQWQKNLGGTLQEYGYAVAQTNDAGFVLVGGANSKDGMVTVNKGLQDMWIVKLDASGNLLWEKSIGGSSIDQAETVIATSDGGFILGGYTSSTDGDVIKNDGGTDIWIVKFDAAGNINWQRCYGGSKLEIISDLAGTTDGGYIFTGYSHSADDDVQVNKGNADLWVVKLDALGNIQWQKTYGGSGFDAGEDVNPTQDGGYIITGMSQSSNGDVTGNHGLLDFWVLKINAGGNLEWQQCYGGSGDDFGAGGFQAADKTYFISGHVRSTDGQITGNKGSGDSWVLNLDATGAIKWQKNYGGTGQDATSALIPTSDGWFATVGFTSSNNGDLSGLIGSEDFWIMKFGPDPKCIPVIKINTTSNNICLGTSVVITAAVSNGGTNASYKWKVNGVVAAGNIPSFSAANFRQGDQISCEYSCRTACGKDTAVNSNVIVIQVINDTDAGITIAADKPQLCTGDEVNFTATVRHGNLQPTYVWLVNGVSQGVTSTAFKTNLSANAKITCLMALTTPACPNAVKQTSNEIDIIVHPITSPVISIAASADTICRGSTATFTATSNSTTDASYVWKVNGVNVAGNGPVFSSSTLQDKDIVSCTVTVSPAAVCYTSRTANSNDVVVHVKNIPAPTLHIDVEDSVQCKGKVFNFSAHPSNVGPVVRYQWKINGVNVFSGSGNFSTASLSERDRVTCVIQVQNNLCSSGSGIESNVIQVNVKPAPLVSFSPSEVIIGSGKQVQLKPKIIGNPAVYQWTPAQLLKDAGAASPLTLPLTTDTAFRVNVTDVNGCSAAATVWVKVQNRIYMPNAFSPDGDGNNDVFRIPASSLINLRQFSISNRWGEVVFSTKDRNVGWNGKYKGILQSGLFVYMISGTDDKGPIFLKGTVVVVR